MNKGFFLICVILVSCFSTSSLNKNKESVRFNGVYYSKDGYKDMEGQESMDYLIFYKNGKILKQRAMVFELNDMDKWYSFITNKDPKLFDYSLEKDSVHFTCQSNYILTYYEGKIYTDSIKVKTTIDTGEKEITNSITYPWCIINLVKKLCI